MKANQFTHGSTGHRINSVLPAKLSSHATAPGFVCKEGIRNGGGSGWVPQRGRLFKHDFPSAKFWVNFFWGGWISEPKDPPPLVNRACTEHSLPFCLQETQGTTCLQTL